MIFKESLSPGKWDYAFFTSHFKKFGALYFYFNFFPQKTELYVMAIINYSFRSSEMNGGTAYDLK